jgi:hypothetical protein
MAMWQPARSTLAVLVLALALGGCTKTTGFSITKHFTSVSLRSGQVSGTGHVDLAAEAGGAWSLRSHVKSLDLAGLDATITEVSSGGDVTVKGTVILSRSGRDPVTVGTWSEVIPKTAPHTLSATLSDDGRALLEDALRGDGLFDVKFTAASSGSVTFDADVTLHVGVTYSAL